MEENDLKPLRGWDMNFSQQISALRTSMRPQYTHIQGEVNSIAMLDIFMVSLFS